MAERDSENSGRADKDAERAAKASDRAARRAKKGAERAARAEARKKKPPRSGRERALFALDLLCAVSGVFLLVVYLPYCFWHLSKGHLLDVVVSLLVLVCTALPFFLRKLLRRLLKKAYTPLKAVWCFCMCFYMVSFSVFAVYINFHGDEPYVDDGKQPVVVVFGCQIHTEDHLSAELYSRLDSAAEALAAHPGAICVVSGGKGSDEPVSEAYAMKKYLVGKKGVDPDRILLEDRSSDTDENVRFTLELLQSSGYPPDRCSLICVSSNFHTPRIALLLRRQGCECATVSAPTPYLFTRCVYTVREYMSYIFLWLFSR